MTALASFAKRALVDILERMAAVAAGLQDDLGHVPGRMAGLAVEALVRSGQRISGLGGVVEAPARPAIRIVAERAIRAQTPFVKPILMATGARRLGVLERRRAMTLLAGDHRVAADQWKARQIVVERHGLAPADVAMALLATAAELAFVGILLPVAGHAAHRQLVAKEIAGVAAVAFDCRMRAVQGKLRAVMIELRRFPPVLAVTVLAFGAVACRMDVLQAMTRDAGGGDIGVALAGVTRRAIDRAMGALERKPGGIVIEALHAPPGILAVAPLALRAELSLVRIARLVAIDAEPRGGAKLDGLGMTISAGGGLVGVPQAEIGDRVIEGLAIELHDVGVAAFMIGMTHPAFLPGGIELMSVKSPSRRAIRRDLLVTIETLAGL